MFPGEGRTVFTNPYVLRQMDVDSSGRDITDVSTFT